MTICINADGSDKIPLWVIGKFLSSRCFKNVDRRSLGVVYRANKNAWMTCSVFKLWLEVFIKHVAGRKVILILDNCSAHIKEEDLEDARIILQNTTLLYLPPNATSKI